MGVVLLSGVSCRDDVGRKQHAASEPQSGTRRAHVPAPVHPQPPVTDMQMRVIDAVSPIAPPERGETWGVPR